MRLPWPTAVAVGLAAALVACGGGGSSGTGEASVPSGVAAADGAPAAPSGGPDTGCGDAAFQATALRLLNERRAAGASCGSAGSFGAAPALAGSATLAQAAWLHSSDMATRDYFSHTGPDGSTPGTRATAAGYAWSSIAENIAAGQPDAAAVVDGWMASPGHCRNIMTATLRDAGMACARIDASTYRTYYTLLLGTSR